MAPREVSEPQYLCTLVSQSTNARWCRVSPGNVNQETGDGSMSQHFPLENVNGISCIRVWLKLKSGKYGPPQNTI